MKTEVVDVTPGLAETWLADKAPNRRLRKRVVQKYAKDMAAGRWRLTHQGIAFDESGAVIDGQHRLAAVVLSSVVVPMLVVRGVPRAAQLDMDQHAKRGADDALTLAGFNVDKTAVSIARGMHGCGSHSGLDMTIEELSNFMERHRGSIDFARLLVDRKVRGVSQGVVAGALARAYYHEDRDRLAHMIDVLTTGVQGDPPDHDSAAVSLRNLLILVGTTGGTGGSSAPKRREIYLKTVRAIELFCRRKPSSRLYAASVDGYLLPEQYAEAQKA